MELRVITTDGRHGEVASSVLRANAFNPVEVRFADGGSDRIYLRDLQIDVARAPARPKTARPDAPRRNRA